MAVFSGGCTLDAIEEICSGDPVQRDDVHGSGHRFGGPLARSSRGQRPGHPLPPSGDHPPIRRGAARRAGAKPNAADSARPRSTPICRRWQLNTPTGRATPSGLRQINARAGQHPSPHWRHAIDTGDAALAVAARRQPSASRRDPRVRPASFSSYLPRRYSRLPGATSTAGISLACCWWRHIDAQSHRRLGRVDELCRQALEAERNFPTRSRVRGSRWTRATCRPRPPCARGAYADAISAIRRAAELADADGFPGLAAIFLAYKCSCALARGHTAKKIMPTARGIRRVGPAVRHAGRHRA